MSDRYEYRLCQVQQARVTFVNGEWQGRLPIDSDTAVALATCRNSWEYLYDAGRDGWNLVATSTMPATPPYEILYLQRVLR